MERFKKVYRCTLCGEEHENQLPLSKNWKTSWGKFGAIWHHCHFVCGIPGDEFAGCTWHFAVEVLKPVSDSEDSIHRQALLEINETQGRVCPDFESCKHESCASSYASWAIADKALGEAESNYEDEKARFKDTLVEIGELIRSVLQKLEKKP